jgi:hypothetical protein
VQGAGPRCSPACGRRPWPRIALTTSTRRCADPGALTGNSRFSCPRGTRAATFSPSTPRWGHAVARCLAPVAHRAWPDLRVRLVRPHAPPTLSLDRFGLQGWQPKPSPTFVEQLADQCVGYCGADLKALCTEAALLSLRRTFPEVSRLIREAAGGQNPRFFGSCALHCGMAPPGPASFLSFSVAGVRQ